MRIRNRRSSGWATLLLAPPVIQFQFGDPGEVRCVSRYQDTIGRNGRSRNDQVGVVPWIAILCRVDPQLGRTQQNRHVDLENGACSDQPHEPLELSVRICGSQAAYDFIHRERRKRQSAVFSQVLPRSALNGVIPAFENFRQDIGIEYRRFHSATVRCELGWDDWRGDG